MNIDLCQEDISVSGFVCLGVFVFQNQLAIKLIYLLLSSCKETFEAEIRLLSEMLFFLLEKEEEKEKNKDERR